MGFYSKFSEQSLQKQQENSFAKVVFQILKDGSSDSTLG